MPITTPAAEEPDTPQSASEEETRIAETPPVSANNFFFSPMGCSANIIFAEALRAFGAGPASPPVASLLNTPISPRCAALSIGRQAVCRNDLGESLITAPQGNPIRRRNASGIDARVVSSLIAPENT